MGLTCLSSGCRGQFSSGLHPSELCVGLSVTPVPFMVGTGLGGGPGAGGVGPWADFPGPHCSWAFLGRAEWCV